MPIDDGPKKHDEGTRSRSTIFTEWFRILMWFECFFPHAIFRLDRVESSEVSVPDHCMRWCAFHSLNPKTMRNPVGPTYTRVVCFSTGSNWKIKRRWFIVETYRSWNYPGLVRYCSKWKRFFELTLITNVSCVNKSKRNGLAWRTNRAVWPNCPSIWSPSDFVTVTLKHRSRDSISFDDRSSTYETRFGSPTRACCTS